MTEEDPIVECSSCGTSGSRSDMFGVEPDLLCARCASGVRRRMHVRFRPLAREGAPHGTVACLALAASLFVAAHMIWPAAPGRMRPDWLGALYQDEGIWRGAVWKHLTSMFLHGGWIHIIFNGFALWSIGRIVESRWGTWPMLGLLLLTGLAGASLEFLVHASSSVGLSGGILGLCGFLIAQRRTDPVAGAVMHEGNVRYILGFVAACAIATTLGLLNIANWAHGGGLATGWGFGWALTQRRQLAWLSAAAALCLLVAVASVFVALGDVRMTNGETWSRAQWRQEWLRQRSGEGP